MGALVATTGALVAEYAPPGKKNLATAITYSGVPVGSLLAALLAILLLDQIGWRGMFGIGALPLVTLLPLAIFKMPESVAWLAATGRHDRAREISERTGVPVPYAAPGAPDAAGAVRAPAGRLSTYSTGAPPFQDSNRAVVISQHLRYAATANIGQPTRSRAPRRRAGEGAGQRRQRAIPELPRLCPRPSRSGVHAADVASPHPQADSQTKGSGRTEDIGSEGRPPYAASRAFGRSWDSTRRHAKRGRHLRISVGPCRSIWCHMTRSTTGVLPFPSRYRLNS